MSNGVTIEEAKKLSLKVGSRIVWRPTGLLSCDYAVVLDKGAEQNDGPVKAG